MSETSSGRARQQDPRSDRPAGRPADGRERDGRTTGKGRRAAHAGARYRRALRRESPTVVGMLLTDDDFAAMTRYASFPFRDYGRYLHHLDGVLRSLAAQGLHVAVTLFDPDGYADYCAVTRRPPDDPATRALYITEVTTARTAVQYTRQSLPELRDELARAADRRTTWERATDLLMDAGTCPTCGLDLVHCAFDRAAHALLRVLDAVGSGTHHVVCSLPTGDGPPLVAATLVDTGDDGDIHLAEADGLVLCTVMAAENAVPATGGLAVRTTDADGTDTVRLWSLRDGEPHPLTEAEVFDAYCTDAGTGEPVPPEPGVLHRAGLPLPPPPPHGAPAG